MTLVWQSWGTLAHHPPPVLLARLFVLVSYALTHAHTYQQLLACRSIHLPAVLEGCRFPTMRQLMTNELWWERLGSVVGTLLPLLFSLPGNQSSLGEGPPGRLLSEWTPNKNSHQQVSYTSHCWFFSTLFSFFAFPPPPSFCFSFKAGTLLYILAALKKRTQRNKTVKVWELFLLPFFFFQELLSVLTLLTQVFVHLWHWISGSASSLCCKISTVNYFFLNSRILPENTLNPSLSSCKSWGGFLFLFFKKTVVLFHFYCWCRSFIVLIYCKCIVTYLSYFTHNCCLKGW